jgi:hypothetical protein
MKIRPSGVQLFHADLRRDERADEANSGFSQFCEQAYKRALPRHVNEDTLPYVINLNTLRQTC